VPDDAGECSSAGASLGLGRQAATHHIPRVDAHAGDAQGGLLTHALSDRAASWMTALFWLGACGAAIAAVTYRAFELDRFFVPKELVLHATALGLGVVTIQALRRTTIGRAEIALAAWLVLSVVAAFAATSGWHAVRALAITVSGALVFLAARVARTAGRERVVARAVGGAAMAAAISALVQAYGVEWDVFAANRVPGGTLGNRNFVAHVAAVGLPVVLWLAATSRSTLRALIGSAAVLVLAAALVLSRTRAAWLAIALWGALAIPELWRGRAVLRAVLVPGRAWLVGGSLVVGIVAALAIPNSLDWNSDSPYLDSMRDVVNYREGSGAGRLKQYTNSLRLVRANPLLGVGPGNWAAEYPAVVAASDPSLIASTGMTANPWPSSDWVAAISECGVPAFLALAATILLLGWHSLRGWRDSAMPSAERLGAFAGGSVVLLVAIQGLFDAVTLLALPTMMLWGIAGAMVPVGKPVASFEPTARTRRAAALGVGVACTLFVLVSALKIDAMRLYSTGTLDGTRAAASRDPESYRVQLKAAELLHNRGMCRLAYHNAMQAAELFPHAKAPRGILAKCASAEAR